MSQTAIATKYTITATTGTAGTTYNPAGRDVNQVVTYRGVLDAAVPLSDKILTTNGSQAANSADWTSQTRLVAPIMETIGSVGSTGYVATPKIAGRTVLKLNVQRSGLMTQANALVALDEFAFALLTDAKLRASVVGYAPADA